MSAPAAARRSDLVQLLEAIAFAARKHSQQRRKDRDASPYINHPIAVATLLAGEAGVEDLAVLQAAILHDTVEDTDTSGEELEQLFGARVAAMVLAVTDDKSLDRAQRKELQVVRAAQAPRDVALVKWADKICNLRDMIDAPPAGWSLERRREYFDWARRVADRLPPVNENLRLAFERAFARRP